MNNYDYNKVVVLIFHTTNQKSNEINMNPVVITSIVCNSFVALVAAIIPIIMSLYK